MPESNNATAFVRHVCGPIAVLMLAALAPAAGSAATQSPEACSRISDEAARLACYDDAFRAQREPEQAPAEPTAPQPGQEEPAHGPGTLGDTPSPAASSTTPMTAAEQEPSQNAAGGERSASAAEDDQDEREYAPLTDEVGLSQRDIGDADKPRPYLANVTRCSLSPRGKYYFYFDNGQVWRQTDAERQEFEDCDFSATIEKDMFGFKMRPQNGARPVRIKRIR